MIKSPHPALDLSFMRAKTREEGGGIEYFNVASAGDYSQIGNYTADCERGRACAQEYLDYIGRHPTNGNATLLGCIALDMVRNQSPKGLVLGFMGRVNEYSMPMAQMMHKPSAVPVDESGHSVGAGIATEGAR
ncbi:hypothetical protein NOJ05_13525 [Neorhizobium galegae]|uniref:hypothetical protein n=1 Tax=Neorhizobium galegae TaxID=399 RepID=UPI00210571E2|nr:hypothetical protein [Neorhizobium galegae]MCQ1778222.1 hypothetical protein [Neorhizobium galegae]MCQ1796804.1 hypothetical protein [Neorhizobium galegae]